MALVIPGPARALLDFIGSKEAPRDGYNTVYGEKQSRLSKPLTEWTVSEVIDAKPTFTARFGSSACGRYQFMRDTLRSLVAIMPELAAAKMTPDVQDAMGYALLQRRGYKKFMAGQMSVVAFGKAVAQEWASFPVLAATDGAHRKVKRGQTYYLGDGVNKVLATATEVEAVLRSLRSTQQDEPEAVVQAEDPPEALYTPAPIASPSGAPWWAKKLGLAPAVPVDTRPGLKPNGDPALYDVQAALKKLRYEPLLLDGLNGERTRNAVRAARRRNGLPDGDAVDAAFRAALPGMLPAGVSETRTDADDKEMQQRSPDLFAPLKGLFGAGSLTTGVAAVGAASDAGILDKVKDTLDNVSGAASSAQQGIGVLFGIGQWLYAHWWIILGVAGVYFALKGYIGWLKLKALWRQGRAS